jgi:hypothetical protein
MLCAVNFRIMKVVCINDGIMSSKSGKPSMGTGIKKGKIYEVVSISKSSFGDGNCYVLKGIGKKRADRFREIEMEWVDELLNSLKVDEVCLN